MAFRVAWGCVGLDGAAEGLAVGQDCGLVGLGGGVIEGEAPVVVAEILDAAEPDFLVDVVPGPGPGGHVAERAAPRHGLSSDQRCL
jgi:hypothetical protein